MGIKSNTNDREQLFDDDEACLLRDQNINSSTSTLTTSTNPNSSVRYNRLGDNTENSASHLQQQPQQQCNFDETNNDDDNNKPNATGENDSSSQWFSLSSSAQIEATLSARGNHLVGLESSPLLGNRQTQSSFHPPALLTGLHNSSNNNYDCTLNNKQSTASGNKLKSEKANYQAKDSSSRQMRLKDFVAKYGNIKWFGVFLFILACIFCIYGIVHLNTISSEEKTLYVTHLKLVNLFGRHGDRKYR